MSGHTDWETLALLYEGLIQISPTLGALVGHAAAIAEVKGLEQGLTLLTTLPPELVKSYQPYWALRAYLCKHLGQGSEAQQAYTRAIGLAEDPDVSFCCANLKQIAKQCRQLEILPLTASN